MIQSAQNNGVGPKTNTVFSNPINVCWFLGLLVVGLAADLVSKSYVFARFYQPASPTGQIPYWWIDGILGIQTSTNPGALFGMGAGYQRVFVALSFVFLLVVLLWMFKWGGAADRWLSICLGMISGGILGNLYDRLGWGYGFGLPEECRYDVRDWILFRLAGVPMFDPWPNFNIADSLLVVGAILLFIHGFWFTPAADAEPRHAD